MSSGGRGARAARRAVLARAVAVCARVCVCVCARAGVSPGIPRRPRGLRPGRRSGVGARRAGVGRRAAPREFAGLPRAGARPPAGFPGPAPRPGGGGEARAQSGREAGKVGARLARQSRGSRGSGRRWPPSLLRLSPFSVLLSSLSSITKTRNETPRSEVRLSIPTWCTSPPRGRTQVGVPETRGGGLPRGHTCVRLSLNSS